MIIDIHGHYTTAPRELELWRDRQLAGVLDSTRKPYSDAPIISDDQIRETIGKKQLAMQKQRGGDVTLFSPRASGMAHHVGTEKTSKDWTRVCNDLIHRVCTLFPANFIGVCQLPQSPGVSPANCVDELERCVKDYGFVGCNLNTDTAGGYWQDPPITDRWWYPLYEKMVELEIPAMIHPSTSSNPNFHTTGAHYINGDTAAFMQLVQGDLFKDFPTLKFIIPHGGGAVAYHWGRYRGLAQMLNKPPLKDHVMRNVFFDTCVYDLAGMELLFKVIPEDSILFASEMIGAVQGIDPTTGDYFDNTKRSIDQLNLGSETRFKVFEGNARRCFGRLDSVLQARGLLAT
jgi:4-oxalmesaconate hydratase